MKRGDLVTVSLSGDYGKPRPALVIQSDLFDEHPSVTVLPITSHLRATPLFRVTIKSSKENGLQEISQVMVDKIHTISREKIGKTFGKLSDDQILTINRALAVFLGFT